MEDLPRSLIELPTRRICGSAEEVGLHYISQLEETELAGKLAMSRERDRILGYTSSGIHKDELEMTLAGT